VQSAKFFFGEISPRPSPPSDREERELDATLAAGRPLPRLLYIGGFVPHFDFKMTRMGQFVLAAILFLTAASARADATNEPPDFNEVLGLVRAHLAGASDADLNRMALDGLLTALRGKVSIVGGD